MQLSTGLSLDDSLGLLTHESLTGQVVHTARWSERGLFECRATITPGGDFLLMFPDGGRYALQHGQTKVNDLLAYRSTDRGETWHGPTVAFDIDSNQHGE